MLKVFFEPAYVAVIGTSPNPAKLGHAVLKNIVEGGCGQNGKIYPINPKAEEILGYLAYPSIPAVLEPIELLSLSSHTYNKSCRAYQHLCNKITTDRPYFVEPKSSSYR